MEIYPNILFISVRHLPVQIKVHKGNIRTKREVPEEYSEHCQTSDEAFCENT